VLVADLEFTDLAEFEGLHSDGAVCAPGCPDCLHRIADYRYIATGAWLICSLARVCKVGSGGGALGPYFASHLIHPC
jgi:hypothetical protein